MVNWVGCVITLIRNVYLHFSISLLGNLMHKMVLPCLIGAFIGSLSIYLFMDLSQYYLFHTSALQTGHFHPIFEAHLRIYLFTYRINVNRQSKTISLQKLTIKAIEFIRIVLLFKKCDVNLAVQSASESVW